MFTERRFFKWNERENKLSVRLGDKISLLIEQNIISNTPAEERTSRYLMNEFPNATIDSTNGIVTSIITSSKVGIELFGFDLLEYNLPSTEAITSRLSQTYEQLDFKNIEEAKEQYKGDLLHIVFKDFDPKIIFLLRF